MSLQFILGNSGCGKSYYLYRHLVDEAQLHPEKVYMLLVPEQFTVQTERELVRLAPDSVIMNIEVLSFMNIPSLRQEEKGTHYRVPFLFYNKRPRGFEQGVKKIVRWTIFSPPRR